MKIKSLKVKDFRNYNLLQLDFDDSTNIFYGNNAQGKTNILEAVYLSGTTKSHRGTKDRDLIRFGENESHIETVVDKAYGIIKAFLSLPSLRSLSIKGKAAWYLTDGQWEELEREFGGRIRLERE